MAYRKRGRKGRLMRVVGRYVKKNAKRIKKNQNNKRAARGIQQMYKKVQGKVPFTYHFMPGHVHHHKEHNKHVPQEPCLDMMTVLVSRASYKWCSKVSKLKVLHDTHVTGRMDRTAYKTLVNHYMSILFYHHAYDMYVLGKNEDLLRYFGSSHHQKKQFAGETAAEEKEHEAMSQYTKSLEREEMSTVSSLLTMSTA